ncbi:hypothetical protein ULG90_10440 [Halopseudomonas pachastrellae]|nr:hypothetical protein ULG90_10440 [Halopseudomonas pachastrellae]
MRHSLLVDAKADILLYGNAERAVVEVAHRLSRGEPIQDITDVRGTAFIRRDTPEGWFELDSTRIDRPGKIDKIINPYVNTQDTAACAVEQAKGPEPESAADEVQLIELLPHPRLERDRTVIRLPAFEKVKGDPVLYAHANRVLHLETNPGNARALVQRHGDRDVWFNPPPIPLSTEEMDYVFACPTRGCRTRSMGANSGLRDDSLLGQYHARLLWWLYLLLDHRARTGALSRTVRTTRSSGNRGHA